MSVEISCPECSTKYKTEFLFCPNCGTNLSLPDKEKTREEISYKSEIPPEYIEAFKQVKEKVDSLKDLDRKIKDQELNLNNQKTKLLSVRKQIEDKERDIENYKDEIENFNKLSINSLFSKVTGSHEDKVSGKENKILEANSRIEALKDQEQRLIKQINNAERDKEKLEDTLKIKDRLKNKMIEIVHRAAQGIIDPVEDEIELKISALGAKIDPFIDQKSKFQNSLSYLQMAQEFLRQAIFNLETTPDEKIQTNALLMDTLTKSEVSHIKKDVQQATTFIEQSYDLLKKSGYKDEYTTEEAFQGMWERFIQNFIRDLKAGYRTKEKTRKQLSQSIADVNKLISWVQSKLSTINFKLDQLMKELKVYEEDLTRERMRILQDAVNKQR